MPNLPGAQPGRRLSELQSGALEVNLQRTAVDVVIPARQAALLEILAPHYGVQQDTEHLLHEINHPFAGWSEALRDLHRRSLSDFAYYNATERGAEAIEIYQEIYATLATELLPEALRPITLSHWVRLQEKIVADSNEHVHRNTAALMAGVQGIAELLHAYPELAPGATPTLRRLAAAALSEHAWLDAGVMSTLAQVLGDALSACYEQWLAAPDPVTWIAGPGDLPEAVRAVSHARMRELADETEQLRRSSLDAAKTLSVLVDLPGQQRLNQAYLRAGAALASTDAGSGATLDRLHWLCRVATSPLLAGVREQALHETRRLSVQLLERTNENRCELLRDIFGMLRLQETELSEAVLDLVTTVGVQVLRAGDTEAAPILAEQLLALDFRGPEFDGFTAEWTPRVNPLHLAHVRAYLRLIEANAELARPIISALVTRLHTRGLFVADTDLFQRDVSSLLAADIEPVYHLVKTLARMFPVYFEEIGAEGELRRISTEIDELEQRRDPLSHFLRKQCHVESNPELVGLVEVIADYWSTDNTDQLRRFLPEAVLGILSDQPDSYQRAGRVLTELDRDGLGVVAVLELAPDQLDTRLAALDADPTAIRKVQLLARLHGLLKDKYSLDHENLCQRLREFTHVRAATVERLAQALEQDDDANALDATLGVLEALKEVVLDRGKTEAVEDIYHKRHIAAGIPSMYGRYREPRFEAMGLILRGESLATVLIERLVVGDQLELPTRQTLQRVLCWLRLIVRGLQLDGFEAKGLSMGVSMLEQALRTEAFSVDQFIDVFRFMSRSMNYLIRVRFLDVYEAHLARLGGARSGDRHDQEVLKASEIFIRDIIASSFMPQHADRLIARVLATLTDVKQNFDSAERRLLLGYRPENAITSAGPTFAEHEGRFLLGYKGEMVKQMAAAGLPTPPGFVITTEAFRCRSVIDSHAGLRRDLLERLATHLETLEHQTGRRYGDPTRPLLLSVRSGAAISMPGMMDTFLNVGLRPEAVQQLAETMNNPWAAWDSYRRFLQCWGMTYGIDRDRFDAEIQAAKEADGVPKKAQLSAASMRDVAHAYADILKVADIEIPEDPFEQLVSCIGLVQASWSSEKARIYRQEMRIAEEWGTAVLVQQMVFGNLGPQSGTGVVFTRDPRQLSPDVCLYGDYSVQSQGEDIVAGLVATHAISESQVGDSDAAMTSSLQHAYPAIYGRLEMWAIAMLGERGFQHQEIEFTFEGPDPEDLYLLQSRDMAFFSSAPVPTFVSTPELEAAKVATGIGVGGGAMYGRVAYTEEDVAWLRTENAEDAIILLRPDTVPDDIPIILQANGLLTTRGGATCHAAVAAQALGRTCVVSCRGLQVDEGKGVSKVSGQPIRAGDFISINGRDGSVYFGKHPVNSTRRRELEY